IALMALPYEKPRDTNLGSRIEVLDALIARSHLEKLCHNVRTFSETWLRKQTHFKEAIEKAAERGMQDIHYRVKRLQMRHKNRRHFGELADAGLAREIELNEMLVTVLPEPTIKLDSIGLIVLSGRNPREFEKG